MVKKFHKKKKKKQTNYTSFPVEITLIKATDVEKQYRKNKYS